mgnify:CR=1 FL=1
MKTTPLPLILLLSLLLLAPTAKAEEEEQDKTNWQDENVLANVSVGTDGSSTDVQVTLPNTNDATRTDTLYTVKTALGLAWIANITNNSFIYQESGTNTQQLYPHQEGFANCTVELYTSLTNDTIDLSGYYWIPIGFGTNSTTFRGTFNGNHKVVKGLKIEIIEDTSTSSLIYAGLFGYLLGNVHDLGIQVATEGIKVKGSTVFAGALAGLTSTTNIIQNCFAIGESDAAISGEASIGYLGGLIGRMENKGSIANCYATLDVKGTVTNGIAYAGGLVGENNGNISHVYATGKMETTGQGLSYVGGVAGRITFSGTLAHALAANKDNMTSANITGKSNYLGRVCGEASYADIHTSTCYASTKIRMNNKVTGISEEQFGKHLDGINADTDTNLGELFPTKGNDAVWVSSTDNLPILKDFNNDLQGTTAKDVVFDKPLDLGDLTANSDQSNQTIVSDSLIFSNTEGWMHKHGADGSRDAFSGRVKGTGTANLAIKTDTAAVLSFKDGTELTGSTDSYASAIKICESQTTGKTTDVTLRSEGVVTVKAGGESQYALSHTSDGSCHVDPKNRFLFYGTIDKTGYLYGVITWKWSTAPKSNVTVNWDGGCVTIPCGSNNSYTSVTTNPGGNNNIVVRVGKDYQKGKLNSSSDVFYSTFAFSDPATGTFAFYYNMQNITGDKGTADNPYVIDLATMSTSATAADSGYTYTDADDRKIVTLGCADGMTEAYYSIENQAANNAHILLTSDAVSTPLCLKARSGSFVDSLQVPASANWTLKGDTLKASYVEVSGGLKLDGPVTVENTENETYNYALKVLGSGSVTVNDVLKAYVTGTSATAIYIYDQGSFMIGEKGQVYAYGTIANYSNKLSITEGGILRCAGQITGSGLSDPAIGWSFTNKPKTELVAKRGSEEVRFTREMFGQYLDEAQTFTANVTADATYKLYQVPESGELIGINLGGDIVETFSTTAGQTIYINVGKPTPKINDEKSITITVSGTYKDSNGATHEFNNILEGSTVSLLKIEAPSISMAIKNVNADSLVVKDHAALFLNGENKLDSIAILEGSIFSIGKTSSTTGLTCSKGVVNRGNFSDYSGLIRSVTIPLADGDVVFSLDTPADVEVARGGRTELKPSGKIPDGANASVVYQWYEWKDNGWTWLSGYNNQSYSFGAGKYMCYVVVTLSDASLKSTGPTVITTLTSYFTVTEKSTPPTPPVVIPTYYTVTLPAVEGATFSRATGETTVEEGTNFTFSITLDADYNQSVPVVTTSRGETIEPRASDGRYVVRDIQEDVVITVTGIRRNDDPTANAAVTPDAVRLWTASGQLHISMPASADLRIYAFDGTLLRSLRLPAGETVMEAPAGPCIVVVGDRRFKVAR